MKKIIGILGFSLMVAFAFAQSAGQHIILVKAPNEARTKLRAAFAGNLKMQLSSTGEFVIFETASLENVKAKVNGILPGVEVRQVNANQFKTLRGSQPQPK